MNTRSLQTAVATANERLVSLRAELLERRVDRNGKPCHWVGKLSASALSTATAISALSVVCLESTTQSEKDKEAWVELIRRGCRYLDTQQNDDGGYGDTDRSFSNIATSYLVLAARTLAAKVIGAVDAGTQDDSGSSPGYFERLQQYIRNEGELAGLRKRYGKDKTFVVPIMTNLAIAGLVDWSEIPRLPFEAAVFPGRMYRFLRMPVVSYAIPALVAIGQAHHFLGPQTLWPLRSIRAAAVKPTTRVLRRMQPQSGGYLEATPLTSFVLMSLAASAKRRASLDLGEHAGEEVATNCIRFLCDSVGEDGSWPIDTNLATWVTSLAMHSLGRWSGDDGRWATRELIDWHRGCQHRTRHPFTGAEPGGWGWSDLSGAVPDGDDTPAAILAAIRYRELVAPEAKRAIDQATSEALIWLADLQNSDGGLPTFCRGWGKLPFDRSSTDLTAHFIRAIDAAVKSGGAGQGSGLDAALEKRLGRCREKGLRFLRRQQRSDGSWLPLWFGNQDNPNDENPIYGTARVLMALGQSVELAGEASRAVDYLLTHQNHDGGWGGGNSVSRYIDSRENRSKISMNHPSETMSTIEESAVALESIADYLRNLRTMPMVREAGRVERCEQAIIDAVDFLARSVESGRLHHAWPIGFYFAKLWYYEELYPLLFATAAFSAVSDVLNEPA